MAHLSAEQHVEAEDHYRVCARRGSNDEARLKKEQRYGTSGHIWQSRFRAFPVQEDDHLIAVLRYVERNALRAELVARAEDWKWSSLAGWLRGDALLWSGDPPVRAQNWLARVNEPLSTGDLQRLRHSVTRGRPFGDESWTAKTAERLGLESCLRPRGRPRKSEA